MVRILWNFLTIFFTLLLFSPSIKGNNLGQGADAVAFSIVGLASNHNSTSKDVVIHKVDEFKTYIDNVKFHKTDLPSMRQVKINMEPFKNQQGVRVDFKSYKDMYLSVAKKDAKGQYYIESKEAGSLTLFCSVHRCEPGVVLLSKNKLNSLEAISPVDLEGVFFLEFSSTIPYIARTIKSKKKRPYIYICPGPGWIHGSTDFSYNIHRDAEYWYDKSKDNINHIDQYPLKNPWNGIIYDYGSILPIPVYEGSKGDNKMICGSIKRYTDSQLILEWGYQIEYEKTTDSEDDDMAVDDSVNEIQKSHLGSKLQCSDRDVAVDYYKIGFLQNINSKNHMGRFVSEPNEILTNYLHDYYVIMYKKSEVSKNLLMRKEYIYNSDPIPPQCIKKLNLNHEEIKATLKVNPSLNSKEYKKHQYKEKHISMYVIDNNSFDKTLSKVDIQCKVEAIYTGAGSLSGDASKIKYFFTPHFSLGFKKTKKQGNVDNFDGKFISNGILKFNKSDFDIYGMYQCDVENYDKYKKYMKGNPEEFLILPKNEMTFDVDVDVSKNGELNKQCYLEMGTFAKLKSIEMKHKNKQTSADVDKLKDNEYFEIKGSGKKYVQIKGELKQGDILTCKYITAYDTTFYTKISFDHKDDFENSEAARDKVTKNTGLFVALSILLFLSIIGATVFAFILIRKRRKRKAMMSMDNSIGNSTNYTKSLSKNVSKNKRSNSKSKMSRSRTKSLASKTHGSKSISNNLSTQKSSKQRMSRNR